MIVVYIIIGGAIWSLFEKGLIKISPKLGWRIFVLVYLIISFVCVYAFAGVTDKFSVWQRIVCLIIFIAGTILRLFYYRGKIIPPKK